MNKPELINMLRNECQIARKRPQLLLIYFSDQFLKLLQRATGLKFEDYVPFLLKNINPTMAGIPSLERPLMWLQKNCRFLSVVRN